MRKLLMLLILFSATIALSQTVERQEVVLEIGTGTWCVWCPGAAHAADQLVENGKDVAVIENHNGDSYANTYSNARNIYNGVSGYPSAMFDGVEERSGGDDCPDLDEYGVYEDYLAIYNLRKAIESAFVMSMSGNNSGLTYNVTIQIEKVADANTNNCVVHLVLTESHIADNWFCMTECNFVNRLMVPDQNGTALNLVNNEQTINLTFNLNSAWDEDHCELVAFIQNNSSHEVYQAIKLPLDNLTPPPVVADFEADATMTCEGETVNFTDLSEGIITTWNWTFEGGTPGTSTEENPSVVYNTSGTYDVTLWVTDGYTDDEITKTAYISVDAAAPDAPGQPEGEDQLCKNPPNQDYTTSGSTNAVLYDWDIDPPTAGFLMNDGAQTITINFVNAFTGVAVLKVKAVNGCGESEWSETLEIMISEPPATFDVTGGGSYCQDGSGVNIGLNGSEIGINYELFLDDEPTGTVLEGTGDPLTYEDVTSEGFYTIYADDPETGCSIIMNNTAEVAIVPNPVVFNVTGGGEYCIGTGGIEIGLDGSETECSYELYLYGVATGITAEGTGEAISFGNMEGEGLYTAVATETLLGCTNDMEGDAEVMVIYMPVKPAAPEGPEYVDIYYNEKTEFTTEGSTNSESYDWIMEPSEAGELEVVSLTSSEATWNTGFEGMVAIYVKGVNECGDSEWSEPHEVMVYNSVGIKTQENGIHLAVSPNPTTGLFTLKLSSDNNEMIHVTITSALNKIVFSEKNLSLNGSLSMPVDLGHVANGIYFLTIETEKSLITRKLVVRK